MRYVNLNVAPKVRKRAEVLRRLVARERGEPVDRHIAVGVAIEEAINTRKRRTKP